MKIGNLTLVFCLFFSIYTFAQQPLPLTIEPLNDTSELDSLLNDNDGLEVDSLVSADETIYKNIWNSTQIRYPANTLPDKNDTITISLFGPTDSTFVMPVKGQILSKFGPRHGRMHTGTDIRLNLGDTVRSAFDGRVRLAKRFNGYGNLVLVRHSNGLETIYAHLSKICVKVNDSVKAGDLVGLGGRTGRATCNHLHFETRLFGEPFDVSKYIDLNTFTLLADKIYYKNKRFENDLANFKRKEPASTLLASGGTTKHVIKKGDTLSVIARKYHTSVKRICAANRITAQKTLKIGSVLMIN
ncbi:MAG: peptidoglycan DD-metalloendopeptidase family protein [Prolixibacteraceae bacterium]